MAIKATGRGKLEDFDSNGDFRCSMWYQWREKQRGLPNADMHINKTNKYFPELKLTKRSDRKSTHKSEIHGKEVQINTPELKKIT